MLIEKREMIMKEAIENLMTRIVEDYNNWTNICAKGELSETNLKMMQEFEEKVTYKEGNKYIRLFQGGSVWGFVVNTENDKKFNYGDILMAAGYNKFPSFVIFLCLLDIPWCNMCDTLSMGII